MSGAHEIVFPKPVLVGAGMLLSATIVLATLGGHGALDLTKTRDALNTEIVDSLDVRFLDREDGAVVALAAGERNGEEVTGSDVSTVAVLDPGTAGFVRGLMRGLVRERRQSGIGAEPPFRITQWADGRLSLADTATGRTIVLDAFGPTNAGVFADMLAAASITEGGQK